MPEVIVAVLIGILAVFYGITNMAHTESKHDDVRVEITKTSETENKKEDKD